MSEPNDPQENHASSPRRIPVTPEELQAPPRWASVEARKEDSKWPELDEIKQGNDKRWLIVYGWILVAVTVVFATIFLGAFIVWSIHYLTCWGWLVEGQLNKIQSILFSGGMGAVVTTIIRSQISKTQ